MVTITNEYGTFKGETEKQAMSAARKGKREAAMRQEQEGREYNAALTDAAENGFKILCRVIEDGTPISPRGEWVGVGSERSFSGSSVFDCYESEKTEIQAAVLLGLANPVALQHTGCTFRGVLLNGSGWAVAYMLTDNESGKDTLYAIGTAAGKRFATVRVPGVTMASMTAKN